MPRFTALLAATGLFAASAAAAQFPPQDTSAVPRDLALALIVMNNWSGEPDPAIVVGRLPDPALAPLVPPGARILGGVSHGRFGPMVRHTAILEVRETPDSILNVLESTFERLGWRRPPVGLEAIERGGFTGGHQNITVISAAGGMNALNFCSDSAYATASASAAGARSIVRLMLGTEGATHCGADRDAYAAFSLLELPTLAPPPGTPVTPSGMGGGMASRETSAQLSSRLTAVEMMRHFVPQLEQQGWKVTSVVSQPAVSMVTGTRAVEGDTVRLMLLDHRYDVRSHFASLRVWNPSGRF